MEGREVPIITTRISVMHLRQSHLIQKRISERGKKRNADRCAICLGSLKCNKKTLLCQHIFHDNCITMWLIDNNTCPLCRSITRQSAAQ
ncbi:hypothetical protein NQ317_005000 [Molorchus minor]|uniref:RING-type domain-containing protein n=1 Tax=Molorchus minor TaxID=1323400 RepID=A0ABQ9K334_9CUCU|nr:hypothetical protein NQ317_005000 [Molorchus minor]